MKISVLMSSRLFRVTGLIQLVFLFLILSPATTCFSAPQTNSVPWSDNFESYTNLTPLINGTNGWYASSNVVVVQTNFVRSGTNAAMIPPDCTLSNWFVSASPTNVWVQMDVTPVLYDGTNPPIVDTNVALMFYVNTNGQFVVHNGPTTDPTNSPNWVIAANNVTISTNALTWVRINIYEDFTKTNCDLYANGVLVTNAIGFINTNLTNFVGFDVYSDGRPDFSPTSYIDNISVTAPDTNTYPLVVVPSALSQSLYANVPEDVYPNAQTVSVVNVWSTNIGFRVVTNQNWVTATVMNAEGSVVSNNSTNYLKLTYANTREWAAGVSNAVVTIVATNNALPDWGTQTVQVVLNMVALSNVLSVTPTQFVNTVWKGTKPTNRTFEVRNQYDMNSSFDYRVVTGASWIASLSSSGTLGAYAATNLTLTNTEDTALWSLGWSNTWVDVVASNSGVIATQRVAVWVNVQDISNVLVVTPPYVTNTVWIGDTPTQQTIQVINTSDVGIVYGVTTNAQWITASTTGGTVAAQSTNTLTATYRATWGWTAGVSNTTVKVASANGNGATQLVALTLNVEPAALNYYVATNGGNVFPYTNWSDAARTLTAAVYKANFYTNVSTVVWLSNGVHNLFGEVTLSNVMVRSLNGADGVTLNGGIFRGFNLVHPGAALNGLTITNCSAGRGTNGGAVFVSTGLVWNCRLLRNTATNGGGVAVGSGGVVRDCLVWGNTATNGGGVYFAANGGFVESCTIASNMAVTNGGGLYTATSMTGSCLNVVVYSNSLRSGGWYTNWGTNVSANVFFTNSCVGLPNNDVAGSYNINGEPIFVNVATGDCRLRQGSPCINTGTNRSWMENAVDLAGNIRKRFGRVDMGAYEWYSYQGMGVKVNGVRYEKIIFINGADPRLINGISNSSSIK